MNKVKKAEEQRIRYFDLFTLLRGLEPERPGIYDRVWNFLKDNDEDIQFQPIHGRILGMNLYYYGVGPEYDTPGNDEEEFKHSRSIHPEAFVEGSKEYELRLDFNLIWSVYEVPNNEVEFFYIITDW